MKTTYLSLLLAIVLMGCQEVKDLAPKKTQENEPMVGGACSYSDYINEVKIVLIEENNSTNRCQKSVTIKYDVIEKAKDLSTPPIGTLHLNVSKEYLLNRGFDIGTTHSMKSSIIKSGTCSPIIESLVGIDELKFQKECQNK